MFSEEEFHTIIEMIDKENRQSKETVLRGRPPRSRVISEESKGQMIGEANIL